VVGARSRLAIACDGDHWSGPDAYEHELASQRDLERCGWQFYRVRESAFYVAEPAVLSELLTTLRELDIHPADPPPPTSQPAETPVHDTEMSVHDAEMSVHDTETPLRVAEKPVRVAASPVPVTTPAVDLAPYKEFTGSLTPCCTPRPANSSTAWSPSPPSKDQSSATTCTPSTCAPPATASKAA